MNLFEAFNKQQAEMHQAILDTADKIRAVPEPSRLLVARLMVLESLLGDAQMTVRDILRDLDEDERPPQPPAKD